MEITFADLAAISAQCEREIYARVVYEMLQQFTQGFFAGGFLVTRVTATQVSVAAGNGFYQDLTQVAPEPTMRPLYLAAASAQNITGPDASNPRWDIVCVRANRANTVSASRKYKAATTGDISTQTLVTETDWASDVLIVAGTPAGSPAAPATPAGYVKIATLVVTAVSGIAASGAITDQRTILPVGGTVQYNTLGFAKLTAGAAVPMNTLLANIDSQLAAGGGGGGGGLRWSADGVTDGAVVDQIYNNRVAYFPNAATVRMCASFQVPAGYVTGNQISVYVSFFTPDTSGNMKMKTVSTLVRQNTDAMNSTTNQRSSTNTQLTNTIANAPRRVLFDLTSSIGQVNGVAVTAGDIIHVEMTRDYGSETSAGASEVAMILDTYEPKLN
jgi:hypothetical protein